MRSYEIEKHHFGDVLIRTDGHRMTIPQTRQNHDYVEFLAWEEEGNQAAVIDYRATQKQISAAAAKETIRAIEATQHRAIREAVLTGDNSRLQAIDAQIAAERAKLGG